MLILHAYVRLLNYVKRQFGEHGNKKMKHGGTEVLAYLL